MKWASSDGSQEWYGATWLTDAEPFRLPTGHGLADVGDAQLDGDARRRPFLYLDAGSPDRLEARHEHLDYVRSPRYAWREKCPRPSVVVATVAPVVSLRMTTAALSVVGTGRGCW